MGRRETRTIKQTVTLPATPEDVYDALIDPEKHSEFTGAAATCDARVGGAFTAWDEYITGKNLVPERGIRIVQEWKTSEWPEGYGPSILELTLEKKGKRRRCSRWSSRRSRPNNRGGPVRVGWANIGSRSRNTSSEGDRYHSSEDSLARLAGHRGRRRGLPSIIASRDLDASLSAMRHGTRA